MDYLSEQGVRAEAERLRAEAVKNGLKSAYRWLQWLFGRAAAAMARRRLVAELSQLDDHALQDIGLDRARLENFARNAVNENRSREAA